MKNTIQTVVLGGVMAFALAACNTPGTDTTSGSSSMGTSSSSMGTSSSSMDPNARSNGSSSNAPNSGTSTGEGASGNTGDTRPTNAVPTGGASTGR